MKLLKQLYGIHSPSYGEGEMTKFIADYCARMGAVVSIDEFGNVFATKGECDTYPCVVAHTDQVQRNHSKDFTVMECDGVLFGYSPGNMRQEGLGADDKNGIWVALTSLRMHNILKAAFFVSEEVGCIGSMHAGLEFFSDCRWVVQCDRRDGYDFITNAGGVELCTEEFFNASGAAEYGYAATHGLMTDVMALKEHGLGVCCVNLSCGYYNPHTDEECTVFDELMDCLSLVNHMIQCLTDVWPHNSVAQDYYSGYYSGFELEDDLWYFLATHESATIKDVLKAFAGRASKKELKRLVKQLKAVYNL